MINEVCVSSEFSHKVYDYLIHNYEQFRSGIYQTTKKIYTSLDYPIIKNERLPIGNYKLLNKRIYNFINFWAMYKLNDPDDFYAVVNEYRKGNYPMLILRPADLKCIKSTENDELVDYALITVQPIGKKMAILNCDFLSMID